MQTLNHKCLTIIKRITFGLCGAALFYLVTFVFAMFCLAMIGITQTPSNPKLLAILGYLLTLANSVMTLLGFVVGFKKCGAAGSRPSQS